MPTFKHAKLVRDNIWGWHEKRGHIVVGHKLGGGKKLRDALCEKLHEEADEVRGALTRDELIEEIADIQQILDDLCTVEGVTKDQIEIARAKKQERKGGFLKGDYIETVSIPDENDKWAQYCRRDPNKYPELDAEGRANPEMPTLETGKYTHSKSGKPYEVLGVAMQTETNEPYVIYRPLYETKYELFARPYEMFVEEVELDGKTVPRFRKR